MSFTSVLDTIGKDFKGVFAWLGSPTGQNIIKTGEGVVEAIVPQATALINLGNAWMTEVIKTQALATAAGAQTGSSTQKAAAALNATAPQAIAFAQQYGLPTPTAAQLQAANTAIVAFLNAFPGLATAPTVVTTSGASTITTAKVG
jgi:hypothetical protein